MIDTFFPGLSDEEAQSIYKEHVTSVPSDLLPPDDSALMYFLKTPASINTPQAPSEFYKLLCRAVDPVRRMKIDFLLLTLSTAVGTAALAAPRILRKFAPFCDLEREDREAILLGFKHSFSCDLRSAYKAFFVASIVSVLSDEARRVDPDSVGKDGIKPLAFADHPPTNRFWEALRYPGPHPEGPLPKRDSIWVPSFINDSLRITNKTTNVAHPLMYDVVVIGSGVGGSVVAAELSQAGLKVLVVDKADYLHPSDRDYHWNAAHSKHFEKNAGMFSGNGSMQILAATTWGGGSAINWSCCLETPMAVREEWAQRFGLKHFTSPAFSRSMEIVAKRIGISEAAVKHNVPNQMLLEGCKKLGYHAKTTPQNTANKEHNCGWCGFGCPYNEKQDAMMTWIRDGVNAGCHLLNAAHAVTIVQKNGKATGVRFLVEGKIKLFVAAKRVVVSCGSLNSPALLLRSKVPNPNIGRYLRLHPAVYIYGIYPQKDIKCFQGSIMTTVSNVAANVDGEHYGSKIEISFCPPPHFAATIPWLSPYQYKRTLLMYPHAVPFICIARDYDSEGVISLDSTGEPYIDWSLSKKDSKSILAGVIEALRIAIIEGATEVFTTQIGVPSFKPSKSKTPEETLGSEEFKKYLDLVKSVGFTMTTCPFGSAHQMGSNRMGTSPQTSVVNPQGESWNIKGLYVSDASVFPTSSGVNPMMTNYSISHSIAQFIKKELSDSSSKI